MIQKTVVMLLLDFRSTLNSKKKNTTDCCGSYSEPFKAKTMVSWHTLTYNWQQQSAEGQWLAGS